MFLKTDTQITISPHYSQSICIKVLDICTEHFKHDNISEKVKKNIIITIVKRIRVVNVVMSIQKYLNVYFIKNVITINV